MTEWLHFHFSFSCIAEGNGNPLQCCLQNPRDGEAWWAAIYEVAQSRTWLKWLSKQQQQQQQQRLITLQYSGGFCHIFTWISHGCTCVPHPEPSPTSLPSHPSGLSQFTSFECLVSCMELGLVIYCTYGKIHVSMLFSHIIPPSPSPTESKSLFFISVSFAVSHIRLSLPSF